MFQGRALASDYILWPGSFGGSLSWTGWRVGEQNLAPLNVSIWHMLFEAGYFLNHGKKGLWKPSRNCPLLRHVSQRRQWHPTPVLLPGKSHGRRGLLGCSPWGHQESDTTKRLPFHFSLSCIGEGTGNPLYCSCLENPRDRGAWWAAVYGVAQSWTRLKQLSSKTCFHW